MSGVNKQKAIDKLIQGSGGKPEAMVPVCAMTSLFNARVSKYVEEKSRDEPVEPPSSGGQDGNADGQGGGGEDSRCADFEWVGDDAYKEAPGFQTVCVGGLSKKDTQILFTLMCLMSKKPEAELNKIQTTRGVGAVIPRTETNQVQMSAETCAALAKFLYGRGARESIDLFIRDLRRMSRSEFSMIVPIGGWHAIEYNTIPLSVMVINDVHFGVGGEKKTFAGITVTLSDIFFYKSRHKYGVFNIEAMFRGLKGNGSDAFARMVSYASRFLPTVAMQRKKGKGYKTSVPIEEICPGYEAKGRREKYKVRKGLIDAKGDAGAVLSCGSVDVLLHTVKMAWV